MRKTVLLLIFLAFTIVSFAAKSYSLTLTVKDKLTLNPMPLCTVSIESFTGLTQIGKTDLLGRIVIEGLKGKYITLNIEAQNKMYETLRINYHNPKKINLSQDALMEYRYEEQMKIYQAIDDQYNNADEPVIDDTKDLDTSEFKDATYEGGRSAMMSFLAKNMVYPYDCIEQGLEGKVFLEFIIQKDGRITNVKAIKSAHQKMTIASIRVVRIMPNFNPATFQGKPIKQVFRLPVNFRLD